ncbi:MAG: site-specific integrase [Desulfobacterales bacterium]|jgi:integrase|nr:site-specific integrase [Desulfobacterales bacterium]
MKRFKTDYPGVFFREAKRVGSKGVDRVYYVVFKKDGKVIEAKAGSQHRNDMTPAKAALKRAALIEGKAETPAEKREAERAAKDAEKNRWTIAKIWDQYCESFPENKALRHEQGKFDRYIRDAIGGKEPADLLPLDVDRIRLSLQKAGKKTMAARVIELLRRTINHGVKRGLIPALPFKIEVPKLNNQTTEDLTSEQLARLIDALNGDVDQVAANVMRLALYTGMRRGEIFKLKWSDIDFDRGFISLKDPKGGKDQTIPLSEKAKRIFSDIKKTDDFIFPGRIQGSHLNDCRKSFNRIAKAAQLPKGFRPLHGLRHVYASMLASSGQVDMYTLQRLLTHKSPLMTQRYAHLRDDTMKRASDVAGDIIDNISNLQKRKSENAE